MPSHQQEQGHRDLAGFNQERTFWRGSNIYKKHIKWPLLLVLNTRLKEDLIRIKDPRETGTNVCSVHRQALEQ